VRFNLKNTPRL